MYTCTYPSLFNHYIQACVHVHVLTLHYYYTGICICTCTYPSSFTSSRSAPRDKSKAASSKCPPQAARVKGDSKLSTGMFTCVMKIHTVYV